MTSLFTENMTLLITDYSSSVKTVLTTADGKIMFSKKIYIQQAGHFVLPLQPKAIAAGIYLLTITYDNNTQTLTVIKQ